MKITSKYSLYCDDLFISTKHYQHFLSFCTSFIFLNPIKESITSFCWFLKMHLGFFISSILTASLLDLLHITLFLNDFCSCILLESFFLNQLYTSDWSSEEIFATSPGGVHDHSFLLCFAHPQLNRTVYKFVNNLVIPLTQFSIPLSQSFFLVPRVLPTDCQLCISLCFYSYSSHRKCPVYSWFQ